jgi:sec-independent protein translocase protein TatB
MFGIGPMEIAVIMIFALLFIGPHKLPEVARQLGKFLVHVKRMSSDVRSTVDDYMKQAEAEILKDEREKVRKILSDGVFKPLKTLDMEVRDRVNNAIHSSENHAHTSHDDTHADHGHSTETPANVDGTVAATSSQAPTESNGEEQKSSGPKWDT